MYRAETGREGIVFFILFTGGVISGIVAVSWWQLVGLSVAIGILLNVWLLVTAASRLGRPDRMAAAALGGIPAGLFDAVKIFLLGAVVRVAASFLS
jgi:hypothetical protein